MGKLIEYIDYKGEKYPLRISYYAIKHFQDETQKSLELIDSEMGLIEPLLWYSLVAGHKAEDKELTLKREEIEFMLDETLDQFNSIIVSFFPPAKESVDKKK